MYDSSLSKQKVKQLEKRKNQSNEIQLLHKSVTSQINRRKEKEKELQKAEATFNSQKINLERKMEEKNAQISELVSQLGGDQINKNEFNQLKSKLAVIAEISGPQKLKDETKSLIECGICFLESRNVDSSFIYTFNPCGHTACKRCTNQLNNTCHTCRKKIVGKIRLFHQ